MKFLNTKTFITVPGGEWSIITLGGKLEGWNPEGGKQWEKYE